MTAGMAVSLVLIPLGLGLIVSICGVEIVRVLTAPTRNVPELVGAGIGLLVGGMFGWIVAAVLALDCGWLPFLGSKGHPAMAALTVFAGAVGCAFLGGRVGAGIARFSTAS